MTNDSNTEAIDPSQYEPDMQEGVEYQKPKDLNAASPDHPMYQRVVDRGIAEEEGINPETGDSIPWNVPATILKHMSDSLYQSDEATIREFIANAETACLRVESGEGQIVPDDYQPIVEVTYNKARNELVIQDNGVGIASTTGVEVLRNIGVTTTRDTGSYSGQFGMGLASFLKLIGPMNSMIMQTRSRHTDENYAAYVNLGGFDPIEGGMPEGEYGTRFVMYPKDADDLNMWDTVEKYAENLRVAVHYEEYDENGDLVDDEDWGNENFEDSYSDGAMTTTLEHPGLFKAVMSPEAQGKTLLLSMDIERNDGSNGGRPNTFDALYQFDVRLLDESGAVVQCNCEDADHEGMTPISDAEYQMRDEMRREGHVPESELGPDDLTLPEPTSSRDRLQEDEEFWRWLSQEIDAKFRKECEQIFSEYDTLGDILNLNRSELDKIVRGSVETLDFGKYSRSLQEAVEDEYGLTLDSDVCSMLKILKSQIEHAPRNKAGISVKGNRNSEKIYEVNSMAGVEGDVYMGVSLNQDKAEVVWDMHDNNQVVRVESKDKYTKYGRLFGWKKLKEIDLNNLEEYDISDELYEDITGNQKKVQDAVSDIDRADPTPPDEEELNLSYSDSYREQKRHPSDAVRSMLKNGESIDIGRQAEAERVVLFPANCDKNLSEHYWLGMQNLETPTVVARCNVSTYHYLEGTPGAMHVDDCYDDAWTTTFDSSEGETTIADSKDNLVIHLMSEENKVKFEQVMEEMPDTIYEWAHDDERYPRHADKWVPDDITYAPMTLDELWEVMPAVQEEKVRVLTGELNSPGAYKHKSFKSDSRLYAHARLDWPSDAPEWEHLHRSVGRELDDEDYYFIETLTEADEPFSQKSWS